MTSCGQVPIRTDASRDCDDMALLRALIFVACRAAFARAQSQGAQDCIIAPSAVELQLDPPAQARKLHHIYCKFESGDFSARSCSSKNSTPSNDQHHK